VQCSGDPHPAARQGLAPAARDAAGGGQKSRMDLGTGFRHNLPRLQLTTRDDGHVTILTVDGDLVIGESESLFKKTITRLLETGKVNLLVDLRRVGFLDSSGLGALVRAMTMSQKEGGQTKLLGAGPQVKKLLEMTRLDSVFENHTDMETAVSSF
jgi:anti-sigma B factor antagonist